MKNLFKLLPALLLLWLVPSSCSDSDNMPEQYLEVNYINIAGTWKLSSWNGIEQNDDVYTYLVFDRRDKTFEMHQNIDSGKSRYITGVYKIVENDGKPYIKGYYDHGTGSWEHDYYVEELTKDQMTWTITDDAGDVSVYIRVDEIPEDVLNGTRSF